MERKLLEEFGLEKDAINKIMSAHGASIQAEQQKAQAIAGERDAVKNSLDKVQEQLKAFEGVDVNELKGKVSTLEKSLETAKVEHAKELEDISFNSILDAATTNSRDPKLVKAALDLDTLRQSKNQKEDITAAVQKLAEDKPFLFPEQKNEEEPTRARTGERHGAISNPDSDATLDQIREGAGLTESKGAK